MPHPAHHLLFTRIVVTLMILLFPALVWAEVSDKEPTTASVWALAVFAAVVCGLATYWRRMLVVLVVVPLFWFAGLLAEIHSEDIYQALLQEQGTVYFVQIYCALTLLILVVAFAFFFNLRRESRKGQH